MRFAIVGFRNDNVLDRLAPARNDHRDQARDYAAKSEKFSLEALEKAKGGTR